MRFLFSWSVVSTTLLVGTAGSASPAKHGSRLTDASAFLQDTDGRAIYLKNCRTCHGATGDPNSENRRKYPKIKALNDSTFMHGISDDSLLTVLKKGAGKDMKPWNDKLSAPEMAALIKYVRTLPAKKP